MFTMEYWGAELDSFDRLIQQANDEVKTDRLVKGLTYLGAQIAQQNPDHKREVVDAVVQRLLKIEEKMGHAWFLTRVVEITAHNLPA